MDVLEIKKLDAYFRKLFGNPDIRVVPKKGDTAEVFVGEPRHLLIADLVVVDFADGDRVFVVEPIAVDADDYVLAAIDPGLAQGRGLLNLELGQAGLDGGSHAPLPLDFGDQGLGASDEVGGERLDVVGAAEGVDDVGDAALVLQDQLGVAGDTGGEFRW